jgi:hypothetical protein
MWHDANPKKVEVKEMEFKKGENKLDLDIKNRLPLAASRTR